MSLVASSPVIFQCLVDTPYNTLCKVLNTFCYRLAKFTFQTALFSICGSRLVLNLGVILETLKIIICITLIVGKVFI